MSYVHSSGGAHGSMTHDPCFNSKGSQSREQSEVSTSFRVSTPSNHFTQPPSDQPKEPKVWYHDASGKLVSYHLQNTVVEYMNKLFVPDNGSAVYEQRKGKKTSSRGSSGKYAIKPENIIFQNSNMVLIDKHKQAMHERETKNAGVQFGVRSTNKSVETSKTPSVASSVDSGCFDPKMTRFLYRLWKKKTMCNLFFKVNRKRFSAHKVALAAHSTKYDADFFADISEENTEVNFEMCLPDTTTELAIKEVMRYMYTSEIRLNYQNIDEILCCAEQLSISCLIQTCKSFLKNCSIEYALSCLSIARKHHFQDVLTDLENIVCKNFNILMKSHHFLQTHVDNIMHFVSSKNLKINSELDVLYAIISWIEFCPEERMKYAAELMGFLHFVLIPAKDLAVAFNEYEHIFQIPECEEMVMYAFSYHTAKTYGCNLLKRFPEVYPRMYRPTKISVQPTVQSPKAPTIQSSKAPTIQSSRAPTIQSSKAPTIQSSKAAGGSVTSVSNISNYSSEMCNEEVGLSHTPTVLAIGGMDPFSAMNDNHCPFIEGYSRKSNSWNLVANMPEPRHHAGTVMLDGYIYVIGGSVLSSDHDHSENCNKPTNSCFRYDPVNNSWSSIAPMQEVRMYHSVTIVGDVLYAIGGHDEQNNSLKTVEYYNPDTNTWRYIPSMSEPKIGSSAVGFNGLLYVAGGYLQEGTKKIFLDTVECFNPSNSTWEVKDPLPIPICHANMIVASDSIYLIGGATILDGNSSITSLNSVLWYSEERDEWERIQELNTARHDAGATAIGSRIYIVGGLNLEEGTSLSSVECLDVETETWQRNVTPLTHSVYGLSCCTLPEVDYYMQK